MRRSLAPVCALCALFFFSLVSSAHAQDAVFVDVDRTVAIETWRGADDDVDYAALLSFGPWDDRNYDLTADDLSWLSTNEAELSDAVPAWFRIEMRRAWPALPRTGPTQYPRSALQIFFQNFSGYLVNGEIHYASTRQDGKFYLELDDPRPIGPDPEPNPEFLNGESRVSPSTGYAESAIAVNPIDSNRVIAGSTGPFDNAMHWSSNGGDTWTLTSLPQSGSCCDPTVDWSADGGFAYSVTLGSCGFGGCPIWFFRSDDNGQTWDDMEDITPGNPVRVVANSGADKEYMHVDKYSGSPHKDSIYITWHQGNVMYFSRSTDFGNTWNNQNFSSDSAERGIGSDITTDKNGHIYYLWPGTNSRTIRLRKSTNGGVSFSGSSVVANTEGAFDFPVPSMESRRVFIYVSAGADLSDGPYGGSIYASWTDNSNPDSGTAANNHARIQVAYSRDGGNSWTVRTPHETADQLSVDRWHQWLAVGEDGTVHVVFYDTRNDPSRASVDLYYSYSTDGGDSWSSPSRVTTQISPNISGSFEFGDYNGLDIVLDDLIAIFTDNRNEGGGGGNSVDVYSAGITPGSGSGGSGAGRVFGSFGVLGQPMLLTKEVNGDVTLDWDGVCTGTDYAVYEGVLGTPDSQTPRLCSTSGATQATLTPSGGSRFYLVVGLQQGEEGSYGRKSDLTERAPQAGACVPQLIAICP